jgi:hypothetical protein
MSESRSQFIGGAEVREVAPADAEREQYLARTRARLVAARDGGRFVESEAAPIVVPAPVPATPGPAVDRDVKPENVAPIVSAQTSPYSDRGPRPAPNHLAEELCALAAELSHDSLDTLVVVARRLARCEERAR